MFWAFVSMLGYSFIKVDDMLGFPSTADDFNEIPKLLSFCIQTGRSSPYLASRIVRKCGTLAHLAPHSAKSYRKLRRMFCDGMWVTAEFTIVFCLFALAHFCHWLFAALAAFVAFLRAEWRLFRMFA